MRLGTLALVLMALWFAFLGVRAHVRKTRSQAVPAGVTPRPEFRGHSTFHFDEATQALRAFATEYRLTHAYGKCTRQAVLALHGLRDKALKHMYELRMRLPNDLHAEAELAQHIEDTDRLLRGYIQDAQARSGQVLLHPGPIDDMFYRQFYRAHNDEVA